MAITKIKSGVITDGTITNADLSSSVAVTGGQIADDAVTLAKMAGLARGKIIVGDASGDPSALTVGASTQVLTSDGTDAAWAASAVGGKVLQLLEDNLNTTVSTTSTSYVASGMSIAITPASTGSKFLLTLLGGMWGNTNDLKSSFCTFYVDTGSGAGEVSDTGPYEQKMENHNGKGYAGHSMSCLHSPSTVSEVTYTVYYKAEVNTTYFNWASARTVFTVMELSS